MKHVADLIPSRAFFVEAALDPGSAVKYPIEARCRAHRATRKPDIASKPQSLDSQGNLNFRDSAVNTFAWALIARFPSLCPFHHEAFPGAHGELILARALWA